MADKNIEKKTTNTAFKPLSDEELAMVTGGEMLEDKHETDNKLEGKPEDKAGGITDKMIASDEKCTDKRGT